MRVGVLVVALLSALCIAACSTLDSYVARVEVTNDLPDKADVAACDSDVLLANCRKAGIRYTVMPGKSFVEAWAQPSRRMFLVRLPDGSRRCLWLVYDHDPSATSVFNPRVVLSAAGSCATVRWVNLVRFPG